MTSIVTDLILLMCAYLYPRILAIDSPLCSFNMGKLTEKKPIKKDKEIDVAKVLEI